jgi:hypothetical protein
MEETEKVSEIWIPGFKLKITDENLWYMKNFKIDDNKTIS